MSYWLEDSNGYLGDFASNTGVMIFHEDPETPPALKKFVEIGEAKQGLVNQMLKELEGVERLGYIHEMLSRAVPLVIITDGAGYVNDEKEPDEEQEN